MQLPAHQTEGRKSVIAGPVIGAYPATMNSEEAFNWPDGDAILRSTDGSDSRDFRLHKFILSLASPAFRDMLSCEPSGSTNVR